MVRKWPARDGRQRSAWMPQARLESGRGARGAHSRAGQGRPAALPMDGQPHGGQPQPLRATRHTPRLEGASGMDRPDVAGRCQRASERANERARPRGHQVELLLTDAGTQQATERPPIEGAPNSGSDGTRVVRAGRRGKRQVEPWMAERRSGPEARRLL